MGMGCMERHLGRAAQGSTTRPQNPRGPWICPPRICPSSIRPNQSSRILSARAFHLANEQSIRTHRCAAPSRRARSPPHAPGSAFTVASFLCPSVPTSTCASPPLCDCRRLPFVSRRRAPRRAFVCAHRVLVYKEARGRGDFHTPARGLLRPEPRNSSSPSVHSLNGVESCDTITARAHQGQPRGTYSTLIFGTTNCPHPRWRASSTPTAIFATRMPMSPERQVQGLLLAPYMHQLTVSLAPFSTQIGAFAPLTFAPACTRGPSRSPAPTPCPTLQADASSPPVLPLHTSPRAFCPSHARRDARSG